MLCMFDPPRADTAATINEARELGISIKMLTGDAVAIAVETCKQLSLGQNVYDSERLIGGTMSGSEVRDFIEGADGFAEMSVYIYSGNALVLTSSRPLRLPRTQIPSCGHASRTWASYSYDR